MADYADFMFGNPDRRSLERALRLQREPAMSIPSYTEQPPYRQQQYVEEGPSIAVSQALRAATNRRMQAEMEQSRAETKAELDQLVAAQEEEAYLNSWIDRQR